MPIAEFQAILFAHEILVSMFRKHLYLFENKNITAEI